MPLALLSVIWGSSFLFIEVALRQLSPLQVAFGRVSFGAVAIVALLLVTRSGLPQGIRVWRHILVVAISFNVVPFILFAWAQTHISSVLAGIWNATTPLWTVLMGLFLLPAARLSRSRLGGLALGFIGVVVVLGPWSVDLSSPDIVVGSLGCLAATACYGFSVTYMARFLADGQGAALVGAQLIVATTVLLFITAPVDGAPEGISWLTVGALIGLGVFGTGIAYVLMYRLVRVAGPTTASMVTYLTPIVSTLLGVIVLSESMSWHEPVGAAIVLSGVWLSRNRPVPPDATEPAQLRSLDHLSGGSASATND